MLDDPEERHLTVGRLNDAGEWRQVATYAVNGFTAKEIAGLIGLSERRVTNLLNRENVKEHMRQIDLLRRHALMEYEKRFDDMMEHGLNRIEGILKNDEAPDVLHLKAAEFVADRHPSGRFVRQSKQELSVERKDRFDSAAIEELKKKAQAITITAEVTDHANLHIPTGGETGDDIQSSDRQRHHVDPGSELPERGWRAGEVFTGDGDGQRDFDGLGSCDAEDDPEQDGEWDGS